MELSEPYSTAQHSLLTMESLRRDEKHCDAVIEAGGEKFNIHKSVFAIYSDYFDKVFMVEMQEKYNGVVKLENTRSDVMKCIVDFIYTGQLSINGENAMELLEAADYLRIDKIKKLSVNFLIQNVDSENCVSAWICAITYNVEELCDKSLAIFGANLSSIPHEQLDWLSQEQFVEIMESSKDVRKSEEESFSLTATWAKCDLENRKITFCKMLPSFKLSLFSKDFLSSIAKDEELIMISAELPRTVVVELVSRLEKGRQKHRELEKAKQETAKRVVGLIKENKRLAKRVQECVKDAEKLQKLTEKRITEVSEESQRLIDLVEESKNESKVAAKKTDELIEENKKLLKRTQESEKYAEQANLKQQGLDRKITDILNANHTLAKCNLTLRVSIRCAFQEVCRILRDSAEPSLFWPGVYLSNRNKNIIEIYLDRLDWVAKVN